MDRLVAAHGDDDPAAVNAGDLKDLIAAHVLANRSSDDRGATGRASERTAVAAFRHFWAYLGDKRWATDNVAMRLRKPSQPESNRRGWRPEEAALVRHLARGLKPTDPLLNEVSLGLSERMGLRREESCRLRMSDIDWDRPTARVWGKADKVRIMPIPPVFLATLRTFVDQRRPADIPLEEWLRSDEKLLRSLPTERYPQGRPIAYRRFDRKTPPTTTSTSPTNNSPTRSPPTSNTCSRSIPTTSPPKPAPTAWPRETPKGAPPQAGPPSQSRVGPICRAIKGRHGRRRTDPSPVES